MTDHRQASSIRVDIPKNRLYCIFAEKITGVEVVDVFAEIQHSVARLKPNFDVVADLSHCHLLELAAIPMLRKIMHYFVDHDVREVVRVVDRQSTVYRQFVNLSARIHSYKPIYVSSPAEAEALLDQAAGRNSLRFNLPNTWIAIEADTGAFTGKAIDVSFNGCAITSERQLPLGTLVQLKLPMTDAKAVTRAFEISAQVARTFADGFAVTFLNFKNADQKTFRHCLTHELKQEG